MDLQTGNRLVLGKYSRLFAQAKFRVFICAVFLFFLTILSSQIAVSEEGVEYDIFLKLKSETDVAANSQTVSGSAYIENDQLILDGATICIQKINQRTGDLFIDPTVTAHFLISEEAGVHTGAEQVSGIRLHSGTKTLDVVLSCSVDGAFYKVYSDGQEAACKEFSAGTEYILQVLMQHESLSVRITEDGHEEELIHLEDAQAFPNPANIYLFLESKDEQQKTIRKIDSVEILSQSIHTDDTAVNQWRIYTQ